MLKKALLIKLSSLLLIFFLIWVLISPYQEPEKFSGKKYSAIKALLGKPDVVMSGKYVAWKSNRFIGGWVLQVSYESELKDSDISASVKRYFYVGSKDFSFKVFEDKAKN
jgi:hypothetical protein